ncbi:MAG: hypothetical protein IT285_06060 [Bdellovibrionales bacterium]|nr:hypothetical protein [Bdellovibrionales bacterium]
MRQVVDLLTLLRRIQVRASGLALLLFSLLFGVGITLRQIRQSTEYGRNALLVLAQNLATTMEFDDARSANDMLRSLSVIPEIAVVQVRRKDGTLFASYGSSGDSFLAGRFGFIRLNEPISVRGEEIGRLELILTLRRFYTGLAAYIVVVLLGGVAAYLVTILLSLRAYRSIDRQFQELSESMSRIAGGRTFEASVPPTEDGMVLRELTRLRESFNEMVAEVQVRDLQLSVANKDLEHKVVERTRDLREAQAQIVSQGRIAALAEISAGIAHEINNPISVIVGHSEKIRNLVARGEGKIDPEVIKASVAKIEQTGYRIARIVRSLKQFSRDGKDDPPEVIPVKQVIEDTLELCRERFNAHSVELHIGEIPSEALLSCRPHQISQVVLNLLTNSLHAVQGLPAAWVRVETTLSGDQVRIRVTDSGEGIPPEIAAKIMQPFFTIKEAGKGTGLGLSISLRIIESHAGRLWLDRECANTSFVVDLPAAKEPAPALVGMVE